MFAIVRELIVPSNVGLFVAALGVALYGWRRWRRLATLLLASSALLLLAFSSGWTAAALLGPLEYSFAAAGRDDRARSIVVLAAYAMDDRKLPLSSRPNHSALFRIVEAVHVRDRCTDCPIVVTGVRPTVDVMRDVLHSLGVPATEIALDPDAANTAQSAANLASRLRGAPFYLVTSAGHMPRALESFRRLGLEPLPAPTDYLTPREFKRARIWPTPEHLRRSDIAVHEYLGLLWYRMTGPR